MMKKRKDGAVVVSIDPGYDGTKVTVNGERFSIPKKTVRKIGNEYESMGSLDGIYEVDTKDGSFLCGPNIQVLVDDNEDFHKRFDKGAEQSNNYAHFATKEFVANTMASLTLALLRAQKEGIISNVEDLDKTNLYVVVELPHEAVDSMTKTVAAELLGKHEYAFKGKIEYADGETEEVNVNINVELKAEDDHFIIISQVLACLFGYITDEEGYEIDSLKDAYPTLVIDGGYYTVGNFAISKTRAISGAASKTEYGMKVVHERTAEAINQKCHTNYKAFDMDNLFKEEGGIVVIPKNLSETGKNEAVDCNKILEEETRKVFAEYLAYLEETYNYFTKIKMILFGGGTGEIYYKLFMEVADQYPNVEPKLVTYKMNKEEVTPREAISAGAYKMVLNRLPE